MGTAGNGHTKTQEVEQRELPVELTEAELRERGDRMAEAELQIETLKSERRDLNAAINSQVELRAKLAHTIDSGTETRDVRCKWIEDFDKNCWRLVRQDNGAAVDTRAMTAADRQGSLGYPRPANEIVDDLLATAEAIDPDTGEVTTLDRVGGVTVERDATGCAVRLYPHVPSDAELAAERAKPKRKRVANPSKPPAPFFEVETVDVGTQRIDFGGSKKRRAGKSRDMTAEIKARSAKQGKPKARKTTSRHANA
jgi:hypothetical protein